MKSWVRWLFLTTLLAAPASAAAQDCVIPDLFVVLDRSGSMEALVGNRTRWEIATDSLGLLATLNQRSVRWGFLAYPGDAICGPGEVSVTLPSSGSLVTAELAHLSPAGGTPIAESLDNARVAMLAARTPEHPQWALLITDGQPNCNDALDGATCACTCLAASCSCTEDQRNCLDDLRTEKAVQDLRDAGIRTFVLGFGDEISTDALDRLAVAGGTAAAESPKFIQALTSQQFVEALNAVSIGIGVATRPCSGPCGGSVERCTELGWGECEAPAEGDVRPCRTADGGGVQSCTADGWGVCEVNVEPSTADDTGCGCVTTTAPVGVAALAGFALALRLARLRRRR